MDTQKFYAGLKQEDRERVEAVVAAFKSNGLQVYANFYWGNLTHDLEISLSATPNKGMTVGDVRRSVDDVVRQFHGQEVREAVPESLRGSVLLDGYIRVDNPQFPTPAEKDATKKALEEFIKPMTEKRFDYKTDELNPLQIITFPLINEERYNNYNKYKTIPPDDSGMTSLSEEVERLDRHLDKEVERLRREFGLKGRTSYNEKYPPTNPIPPSRAEFEPLDKMPPMDSIKKTIPPEQLTVVREQRYRIGTIGETPIEVRVSYKPIDALSKLIKVEL